MTLLPSNFDELLTAAVRIFWTSRASGSTAQEGTRGNVIGGKNLDGFIGVVEAITDHCGIPRSAVFTRGKTRLTIPGYFRPTKNWDILIIDRHRLLAVLEFKSQVGSFGNNFNNRTEEALGLATDLHMAARKGLYRPERHHLPAADAPPGDDPRPPFLGYLLLLEDSERSTRPVTPASPHYPIDPAFHQASYADRYRILCERLMSERLYGAATLMLSPKPPHGAEGQWRSLSRPTDPYHLFNQLAATLQAAHEESQRLNG